MCSAIDSYTFESTLEYVSDRFVVDMEAEKCYGCRSHTAKEAALMKDRTRVPSPDVLGVPPAEARNILKVGECATMLVEAAYQPAGFNGIKAEVWQLRATVSYPDADPRGVAMTILDYNALVRDFKREDEMYSETIEPLLMFAFNSAMGLCGLKAVSVFPLAVSEPIYAAGTTCIEYSVKAVVSRFE